MLTGFAGVALLVPWLLMEWKTIGYVFYYVTDGLVSPLLGIIIGIFVVVFYAAFGVMLVAGYLRPVSSISINYGGFLQLSGATD